MGTHKTHPANTFTPLMDTAFMRPLHRSMLASLDLFGVHTKPFQPRTCGPRCMRGFLCVFQRLFTYFWHSNHKPHRRTGFFFSTHSTYRIRHTVFKQHGYRILVVSFKPPTANLARCVSTHRSPTTHTTVFHTLATTPT
jgi:hypothetical protein